MKVFVGYDPREDIAYQVCEYSILKHRPDVEIIPLKQTTLREQGIYTRPVDPLSSTEFTFTRFLVPQLTNYSGWAVFVDCDFLFLHDINELFAQACNNCAVMVVKHNYAVTKGVKMDGCPQLPYPRKNWSSIILWNCGHPANQAVCKDVVNYQSGTYLHRFGWLKDEEIGELDKSWNWLVGHYHEPIDGIPKALHYTEGGPWFKNYRNCEYNEVWKQHLVEMLDSGYISNK